jgi:hypothetical protein
VLGPLWDCRWFLLRSLIGKQELGLDLDLHGWLVGLNMFETSNWSVNIGPLDLECEWGKHYRDDEWPMKPTSRLFSKTESGFDSSASRRKLNNLHEVTAAFGLVIPSLTRNQVLRAIGSIIDRQFLSHKYLSQSKEIVSILGTHVRFCRMVEVAVEMNHVHAIVGNVHLPIRWYE